MNKTIVFVSGSMGRGGAERVISVVSNELIRRGWKIYIVTMLSNEMGYELDSEIKVIDISNKKRNQIIDLPRMIWMLRKTIKTIKPDVVVSFMLTINIISWISTRRLSVKFISSERNDPAVGRGRLMNWLSCKAYAASDKVVFQTERVKSFYSRKIQEKGVIIPNPIRVECFRKDSNCHKIVNVGRLEQQKNQRLLIEAFNGIKRKHPEYTLHLFGDGTMKKDLLDYSANLGLTHDVFFHGNVADVHAQISDAEIFVLSSNYEGLSNALLEAVMMGFPCISTDCAGSKEAIIDGVSGYIVPVGNCESMQEAMEKLILNSEKRQLFSQNAKDHSKQFEVQSVVDVWESILME